MQSRRGLLSDPLFLLLICAIPALFYLPWLGFYSDDWDFLATMAVTEDQSVKGMFDALMLSSNLTPRPAQVAIFEGLYRAFGLDPFPGQVVRHLVLWLGGVVLYLAVRRATLSRMFALLLAATYLLLPHYSTARFWFSNAQAVFTLLLLAIALYAFVRVTEAGRWAAVGWQVVAALAIAVALLAYELPMPLMLAGPAVVLICRLVFRSDTVNLVEAAIRMAIATLITLAVIFVVFRYKTSVYEVGGYWTLADWIRYAPGLYRDALRTNFWHLGVMLPVNAALVFDAMGHPWAPVLAGLATGLVAYGTLGHVAGTESERGFGLKSWWIAFGAVVIGLLAFVGGYLAAVHNFYVGFSPTGIANRMSYAASLGTALAVAAGFAMIDLALGPAWRRRVTLPLFAVLAAFGAFMTTAMGVYWAEAAERQNAIFARLTEALPSLEPGSSVLIQGFCPFHGPAPVFTSRWDLAGRLRIATGIAKLEANVVTETSSFDVSGVTAREYAVENLYPYGQLFIYDDRTGEVANLASFTDAQRYFAAHPIDQSTGCTFEDGAGEPLIGRRTKG